MFNIVLLSVPHSNVELVSYTVFVLAKYKMAQTGGAGRHESVDRKPLSVTSGGIVLRK